MIKNKDGKEFNLYRDVYLQDDKVFNELYEKNKKKEKKRMEKGQPS